MVVPTAFKNTQHLPLKLIEIAWREANPELDDWEEDDQQKFAFICGFLTHMAADQIIHPLVNKVAGPYYKSGDHRKVHRECEVYQDVVLYQELHPGQSLLDEKPNLWCDLNRDGVITRRYGSAISCKRPLSKPTPLLPVRIISKTGSMVFCSP